MALPILGPSPTGPLRITEMKESGLGFWAIKVFKAAPPTHTLAWPGCHGDTPVAPEAAASP